MTTLENLREVDLYALLPVNNVKKGFTYLQSVVEATRSEETLKGIVLDRQPCTVEVTVTPTGVLSACTCDAYGRACKHVAALLLYWIRSPERFNQKAEGTTLTAGATGLRVVPVSPPPTQRPKELPFWLQVNWDERQQLTRQQVEGWLNHLRLDDLRTMARNQGWAVKGTRKADVIAQLLDQLSQSDQLLRILGQLDQEHRQALQAIALLGFSNAMRLDDMERVAKFWGKLKQHSRFSTYVRHLTELGLVLSHEQLGQFVYDMGVATIPAPVERLLPPLLADAMPSQRDLAATTTANATTNVSGLRLATPDWLVRTVTQLLVILEQTTPPLRPPMPRPYREKAFPCLHGWDYVPEEVYQLEQQVKGHLSRTVTLTVPPPQHPLSAEAQTELAPLAGDAERLEFLYHLMVSAGLLQPGSPVTVWPEVKEQFLRQSAAQQQAILLRSYFAMTEWSELWPMLRTKPELHLVRDTFLHNTMHHPQNLATELAAFRTLVLTTCAWLPDDRWIKLTDLLDLLRVVWPKFNQSVWLPSYYLISGQANRGAWHLTYQTKPLDGNSHDEWERAQGHFVRTLLRGPLHWLGLVDLYEEAGALLAVRFHGLGDLFLDRVAELPLRAGVGQATGAQVPSAAKGKEQLTIAGDQIAVAPSLITAQAHSLLDRIATLEVAKPHQFVYQLDAATVQKGFEAGVTLAQLVRDWEATLSKPIPASVRERLTGWWQSYGQLRLYRDVTLIEFGDDHALTEMKAVTSLPTVLIAELSPRLVLIPKGAVATLAAELEKAGYTPQQTEATE